MHGTRTALLAALPFWLSFLLVPLMWISVFQGGWTLLLVPLATWQLFSILDLVAGLNTKNEDPETPEAELFWYRAVTLAWVPVQMATLFGLLWYVPKASHLSMVESWGVFFSFGVLSGTIGINYSHELMHQKQRGERWLADILLASVLYSHFRSEHLLVHHRYVGTPRDAVTARYNEGFHRFFPRVLKECVTSSFTAEREKLIRSGRLVWSFRNPFWKYGLLQLFFLSCAFWFGGLLGVFLFITQAFVAVWQLELANYVEHYGLTRKHLGDGKYEHVLPRHSWNAAHRWSNWLLINLQRHSDHHYKPSRRFPLLQNYDELEAPQLPHGYPLMTIFAMIPPLWRRKMNPQVRKWRAMHYPEITDWEPYKNAQTPIPQ